MLSRTARYAETTLKLLSTFDDIQYNESVDNKLAQIVKIQQAQICYLRDEYANLIVQSKFDKSTSQTFRALQKNTSGLNPQALQNLKLASAISASASVPSKEAVTPRPRDSWRNNNSERGYGRRFSSRGRGRGYNSGYYNSQYSFDEMAQRGPADQR